MNKRATPFYLTKKSPLRTKGRYSVILSPEFYWIKRVSLPVKRAREAKRLAESVFEGLLPSGEYEYQVIKEGDQFLIIAYDRELIQKALKEHFSGTSEIAGVYFAQNELKDLKGCTTINARAALTPIDGILVQVPRSCIDTSEHLDDILPTLKLSGHKIRILTSEKEILPRSTVIMVGIALLSVMTALLVEYIGYKRALSDILSQKESLIARYHLPQTSFQLKSIEKSLLKKYEIQKKMRDALQKIASLSFAPGESLRRLTCTKEALRMEIGGVESGREEVLKRLLSSRFKIRDTQMNGRVMKVEVTL
ncbi:MAG: hypothetical protein B6D59_07630 [Campylobacteraceae bacterium 4484_4]|nr:MAG: hypothetical protein B6D59_07630 [Campylobacteraceae bacterium 4484_4]